MIRKIDLSRESIFYPQNFLISERISPCTSYRKKAGGGTAAGAGAGGSITIEASLAVPIFFLAVLSFFYMLEVMAIRTSIRSGMQYAGKAAAEKACFLSAVTPAGLEQDIVQAVGSDRLERSIVEGGRGGLHCEGSHMSAVTSILEMKVTYKVVLPIPLFRGNAVPMEEKMRFKGWSGYAGSGFSGKDDETVYITETGMVYHRDYHCNYLELSIQMVPAGGVEDLRNESQGKYHPCEHCMGGKHPSSVYITDYGDRYHSSLSCSGLKRTIYAVPLSEAAGKGACSKCGR